jgi:ankyrin repeat protein
VYRVTIAQAHLLTLSPVFTNVTGARLNLRDKDNNSVLLNACFSGKTDIVKYLVSNGNGPPSTKSHPSTHSNTYLAPRRVM